MSDSVYTYDMPITNLLNIEFRSCDGAVYDTKQRDTQVNVEH